MTPPTSAAAKIAPSTPTKMPAAPTTTTTTASTTDAPALTAALDRWRARLANRTDLALPTDYPRASPQRFVEADVVRDLPLPTTVAILQLALRWQADRLATDPTAVGEDAALATPFHVLLAAFAVLLHRYTGEDDVSVGSSAPDNGWPIVMRLNIDATWTFRQVVEHVCQIEQDALADPVPFSKLVAALQSSSASADHPGGASSAAAPPFKVRFFNLADTTPATTASMAATDWTIFISTSPSLRRLLPLHVRIAYNTCLYARERMEDLTDQLLLVLDAALNQPDVPVGAVSLVTDAMRTRNAVPDPTVPLHWDQWEGPIHEIFSRNARAHPDRTCAVEHVVRNGATIPRQFTYKTIHRAANTLAHHLLRHGVQREDVVMLYSYRGVDLMVAIMGVLAAGCTFSVIDPAYPPQRQIIYLQVAKPRALVVLKHAGELDQTVRDYVRSDLQLVCEVPALALADAGDLTAAVDLAPDAARASTDPGIPIGPDSIGTLSFTSGSTGIPKGVRGRHFSLTHFYPWMRTRFGLSESDRFTMLSGIAHDPIQRDIFTPLYLGAALYIPTAADIGTPGQLAQWMRTHQVTVTHLTPAMGQLLTAAMSMHGAGATANGGAAHQEITSLRNSFFVGDILTKRDVLRLQHLAPNCAVINMYGTTETQRAVSYLRIPPRSADPEWINEQKDVMPAGQGMVDVQLLVINKTGQMCGVGEVGELYVRSSGLAEGYLGLLDATAAKFVTNPFAASAAKAEPTPAIPFYHGARDRMYRTGDLGRYRPDGLVECSGRADDQVKLRGFRIELGEIDMYLSQHPRVRENVTLVRRDKDEEQTLVSYIVLTDAQHEGSQHDRGHLRYAVPRDFDDLCASLREFLRHKLPAYAVPAVVCPLRKLPLTPNGKVDKHALPFPDTSLLYGESAAAASSAAADEDDFGAAYATLRALWSDLLGVPERRLRPDAHFFDMGGHSILATRLTLRVRSELGVADAPLALVFDFPVLRDMAAQIEGMMSVVAPVAADEVTPVFDYAAHAVLPTDVVPAAGTATPTTRPKHVLVTGATGFLGAFIVAQMLDRLLALESDLRGVRVTCVARARDDAAATQRVVANLQRHACWNDKYVAHVVGVAGDLAKPQWGIDAATWTQLAKDVDAIVHNGAMVHWVYPYAKLAPANVDGTVTALRLAVAGGKTKPVHFVSSTSVLDTPYYATEVAQLEPPLNRVPEADALEGSRVGLRSGYAQTKWVAERLCAQAAQRGVPVTVVRPGYIVGHAQSGVTNGDDFLWRLVKGCLEVGAVPQIQNVVNMCPVDYVAEVVVAVTLADAAQVQRAGDVSPPASPTTAKTTDLASAAAASWTLPGTPAHAVYGRVYHTYNPDHFRFVDLLGGSLTAHGWQVRDTAYLEWRAALLKYVTNSAADSALYPLLHFVLDDLPTSTRAPALDTAHADTVMRAWRNQVKAVVGSAEAPAARPAPMRDVVPRSLAYLVAAGFLPQPSEVVNAQRALPPVPEVAQRALAASGGVAMRTSAAA
ncbi:large subunit of alpha-aminoadipate reductase [Allomyces arbusculus]|nr:large subunit of alpha-aminoadipate reductase [Allomyces arbusculus]